MKGGARDGAGRKPAHPEKKRVPICVKLLPEAARSLRDQAKEQGVSQAKVIEEALKNARS